MDKKILIAYYTLQGNARKVAEAIQAATGGDLFEIELEKPYNLASSFTRGVYHTRKGHGPPLKKRVENMQDYGTVFLGAPVWAYALTSPVVSFIEAHDLSGVAVIPFCTHGGNTGKYFEQFAEKCPTADLTKKADFFKAKAKSDEALAQEVNDWVQHVD